MDRVTTEHTRVQVTSCADAVIKDQAANKHAPPPTKSHFGGRAAQEVRGWRSGGCLPPTDGSEQETHAGGARAPWVPCGRAAHLWHDCRPWHPGHARPRCLLPCKLW